ncbi:MAG: permease-like cell division protein FtsX [Erysipelotrichaceae bacterium]|nr:permease-like cell division protein FtsX [Erysipelotrichaceae bacterium]MDP3304642.1 permease-like cell division protein FtsX [Erysipelotrichaceae bacterium]
MNLFRHFKEAFLGLVRHGAMTVSSASAVAYALLFVGIFIILSINIEQITYSVEESVQIHVKVNEEFNKEEPLGIIYTQISEIVGVLDVEYSSKDEELDKLVATYGEDGKIFESYRGVGNPLRAAYLVKTNEGSDIEAVAESIRLIAGVEKVSYGGTGTVQLMNMLDYIRSVGYILVIGLSIVAVFLISNTINASICSRINEISIMRTVGAKNGFIRMPYVIEGILIGILGSIFPILVATMGYIYLYEALGGVFLAQMFVLQSPFPLVYYTAGILVGIAVFVGLIGSFVSVTRYLRWQR